MRPAHWSHTVPLRVRSLFRRRRVDQELDEELEFHVEHRTEALVRDGLSPAQARDAALRELGSLTRVREDCQDTWRVRWIETTFQDVGYGARLLRKNPAFTAVAAITLALGIGANTAMFSLVNGILLRPLPYPEPDRLVRITGSYPQGGLVALRQQATTMDVASYAEGHDFNMTGRGDPVRLTGTRVSAELFSILGVRAAVGRTFVAGEDLPGRDRIVVLSHQVWTERFGSDPGIIGRSITLDGVGVQVVGVMPNGFDVSVLAHRNLGASPCRLWSHRDVLGWRLHAGRRATAAGQDDRDGRRRGSTAPVTAARALSLADAGGLEQGRERGLAAVGDGRRRPDATPAAAGSRRAGAWHRVRQRRQPPVVAGRGPRNRNGGSRRDWRRAASDHPPAAHRKRPAGDGWSPAGSGPGGLGPSRPEVRLACGHASTGRGLARLARAGFCGVAGRRRSHRVRTGPRLSRRAAHADRLAQVRSTRRIGVGRATSAPRARRRRGRPCRHAGRGVRHSHPQFLAPVARGSWLSVRRRTDDARQPRRCVLRERGSVRQRAPGAAGPGPRSSGPVRCGLDQHACRSTAESPSVRLACRTSFQPGARLPSRCSGSTSCRPTTFASWASRYGAAGPSPTRMRPAQARVAIVSAATARRFWPEQDAVGKRVKLSGQQDWHSVVGVVADVRAYDLQRDVPQWIHGTLYLPDGPGAILENGRVPAAMTLVVGTELDAGSAGSMVRSIAARVNQDTSVSEVQASGGDRVAIGVGAAIDHGAVCRVRGARRRARDDRHLRRAVVPGLAAVARDRHPARARRPAARRRFASSSAKARSTRWPASRSASWVPRSSRA